MIGHIVSGSTHIYYMEIPADGSHGRREREMAAVRCLLEHRFGTEITMKHDAAGAPLDIAGCHISVSHSRRLAVVAIDDERKIGVDAEEYRPKLRTVASRYLSQYELSRVSADADYLMLWTAKEAIYKLAGLQGLSLSDGIQVWPSPRILPASIPVALHHFPVADTLITLAYAAK